jgi:hypothetical protein
MSTPLFRRNAPRIKTLEGVRTRTEGVHFASSRGIIMPSIIDEHSKGALQQGIGQEGVALDLKRHAHPSI